MKAPLETIRLSSAARDRLIHVKRVTGIQHWNEICRWALCLALSVDEEPVQNSHPGKEGVEMSWDTFAGEYSHVLAALVIIRWHKFTTKHPKTTLAEYFLSALEYGISMLPKSIQSVPEKHICGLVG